MDGTCRISDEQFSSISQSKGTWEVPHCGCGHPLTRNYNYNWKKIVKNTIANGETEFHNKQRYTKSKYADYAYYVDSSQILSKMIGHCLKCHKQLQHNVFECSNENCFIKPRLYTHIFDAERLDFNPKLSQYIKFRLCSKCGKDCKDLYNSMVTGYYVNNGKIRDKDKKDSETDYEKYKQHAFDRSTIGNQFFAAFSFAIESEQETQQATYPSESSSDSDIDSQSTKKNVKNTKDSKKQNQEKQPQKIEDEMSDCNYNYVSRLDKKLAFIQAHCICGNEKMIGKINSCGMWVVTGSKYTTRPDYEKNRDGCFYHTPILHCNKCRSKIESFDAYYSCNNGSFVTDAGHEHGYRLCKICAILQKSRLFDKVSLNGSVKIDEKDGNIKKGDIATKLGDDTWLLIFEFAVSSHMNIIHFCQVSKQFNSLFSNYKSDGTNSTKNSNKKKEKRLIIDPRLNGIWKRLVLYYWPSFMSQSMVDTYSTKISQRWDLFFKIRFLSMKQYIKKRDKKNDSTPMRKRSSDDRRDYGKNSGKYVRENSLLRGYIEGCDKQIKEMSKIIKANITPLSKMDSIVPDLEEIASKHNMKNNLLGIKGLSIGFQCPLFWHELRTNEYDWRGSRNEKERICDVCSKKVVSVESKKQLLDEVKNNNCVSFVYVYNNNSKNKNGLITIKKRATGRERDLTEIAEWDGDISFDSDPRIAKTVMFEDYQSDCSNYG